MSRTYWATVKQYFPFNKEEWKGFLITAFVFAFMFSFKEWGVETFDFAYGIKNFLVALVIVAVGIFIHDAGQRLAGIYVGFRVERKLWWYGLWIGLALTIISRGNLLFFAASGMVIHHLAAHRLGHFRYGPNVVNMGVIALCGPLANIIFATIVKTMELWLPFIPLNAVIVQKIFFFNWLYAVLNLLPIPPLDGSKLMYYSRLTYAFVFGTIGGYLLLTLFGIFSYIWALVIGGATWALFYFFFESKWYKMV